MTYVHPQAWTQEETDRLLERLANGETHREIAASFEGRSFKSVINKIETLRHGTGGLDTIMARRSRRFLNAILDAQVNFANRGGMTLTEAQRFLMGGNYVEVTPGTERHLQTCAVERLAA